MSDEGLCSGKDNGRFSGKYNRRAGHAHPQGGTVRAGPSNRGRLLSPRAEGAGLVLPKATQDN